MIIRLLAFAALLLLASGALGATNQTVTFAYLQRADDPAYEQQRAYTGLKLRDRHRPLPGVQLALKESRVLGRALGLKFALREVELAAGDDPVAQVRDLVDQGIGLFILDLPLADMEAVARALADQDVILFNPRHRDDALRGAACAPALFHTIPSHAMTMDALAQYLRKKGWTKILVLHGEAKVDRTLSDAFQVAARKFGLEIVETRSFVLSNDPRQRDQTNVALLTSATDYDVVFLADDAGEVGRYVPFATYLPRPVVGSEGLIPGAWHWTWERHGAPQLNQRFDRLAGRPMTDSDWSAWAAVKAAIEAMTRTDSQAVSDLRAYLTSPDFTLDTYKGSPGNFRPWNRQLRQGMLLHSHNAVLALAPIDGFLHEHNNLDTLGADRRESACKPE